MKIDTLYYIALIIVVMLVSSSGSFPNNPSDPDPDLDLDPDPDPDPDPEEDDDSTDEDIEETTDNNNDVDELKCLAPGDSFDPVNLVTDEELSDGGEDQKGGNETNKNSPKNVAWRKLFLNRYYGVLRDRFYIRNNEGLITLQFRDGEATSAATILGMEDDWKYEYVFSKANILYSQSKYFGSQHAIRGQTYAFELQLVHYKKGFTNLADAANHKHGILVLCLLFESTGKRNPYIDPLAASAIMSVFPSDKLHIAHGPLDFGSMLPADMSNLQYTGLYVTQPCAREAKFVVILSTAQISEKQLKKFREIRGTDGVYYPGAFGEFLENSDKNSQSVTVSKNVRRQNNKLIKATWSRESTWKIEAEVNLTV